MNTKLGALAIFFSAICAIIITIRMFRKDRLSTRLFLMWLFIWLAVGFLALFPSLLNHLMEFVNMGNKLFFLTTGAILILFIIIFYITSNTTRTNRKIAKLAQKTAILNYELQKIKKNDK